MGGLTALAALDVLEADPETEVIVLLGKPPGERTLARLADLLKKTKKPVRSCFLGVIPERIRERWPGKLVDVIDEAVASALSLLDCPTPDFLSPAGWEGLAHEERKRLGPVQRYVRGIFAGGTFGYQAQLLSHAKRIRFRSNAPLSPEYALPNPFESEGHTLWDMGDEFFTPGRLHPMIDPALRQERVRKEAEDPEVAVLLLDFILGYNASPDPAGDLVPALLEARAHKEREGAHLAVVPSVCGTKEDPQNYREQGRKLREAGIRVFPTQAPAVQFGLSLIGGGR